MEENPTIIDDDDIEDTIEVDNNEEGHLYTAQEVVEGIIIKGEREEDITTDSGVDSEDRFDPDSDSNYDGDINRDVDIGDENM
jgi:hypothetical protein